MIKVINHSQHRRIIDVWWMRKKRSEEKVRIAADKLHRKHYRVIYSPKINLLPRRRSPRIRIVGVELCHMRKRGMVSSIIVTQTLVIDMNRNEKVDTKDPATPDKQPESYSTAIRRFEEENREHTRICLEEYYERVRIAREKRYIKQSLIAIFNMIVIMSWIMEMPFFNSNLERHDLEELYEGECPRMIMLMARSKSRSKSRSPSRSPSRNKNHYAGTGDRLEETRDQNEDTDEVISSPSGQDPDQDEPPLVCGVPSNTEKVDQGTNKQSKQHTPEQSEPKPPRVVEAENDYESVIWVRDPTISYVPLARLVSKETKEIYHEIITLGPMVELFDLADARMLRKLHSYQKEPDKAIFDQRSGVQLPPPRKKFPENIYPSVYEVQVATLTMETKWNSSYEPYENTRLVPAAGPESGPELYDELLKIKLASDRLKWPRELEKLLPYFSVLKIEKREREEKCQHNIGRGIPHTRMRKYRNDSFLIHIYKDTPRTRMLDRLEDLYLDDGITCSRKDTRDGNDAVICLCTSLFPKKNQKPSSNITVTKRNRDVESEDSHKGRSYIAMRGVALSAKLKKAKWFWDSGATNHSTNDIEDLSNTKRLKNSVKIEGVGGSALEGTHIGWLKSMISGVDKCLLIPKSDFKLMSLNALLADENLDAEYHGKGKTLTVNITKDGVRYESIATIDPQTNIHEVKFTNGQVFVPVNKVSLISTKKETIEDAEVTDKQMALPSMKSHSTRDPEKENFTANEVKRAEEMVTEHNQSCHPGDEALKMKLALNLCGDLTENDLKLMRKIKGPCVECELAKLKLEKVPECHGPKATRFGQHLGLDLRDVDETNGVTAYVICHYSGYMSAFYSPSKDTEELANQFLLHYQAVYSGLGHTTERLHVDAEATLLAMKPVLGKHGINVTSAAPAGHNVMVERYIQTMDHRLAAVLLSMSVTLPREYYIFAVHEVMFQMNVGPNNLTFAMMIPTTPFALHTGSHYQRLKHGRPIFGDTYVVPMGIAKRKTTAKKKGSIIQAIPKGEIAVSMGVGPYDKRNTKADMFVLGNKKMVLRELYHHMPFTVMKDWTTNPNRKEYSRVQLNTRDKATSGDIKEKTTEIGIARIIDNDVTTKEQSMTPTVEEEEEKAEQDVSQIPDEDIEDIWQEYMGKGTTNKFKTVYGMSKSKIWHSLINYRPVHFSGDATYNPPMLKEIKHPNTHFSFNKALKIDEEMAYAADDKEQAKMAKFRCFGEIDTNDPPNFSKGKDLKVYPVATYGEKIDPMTGTRKKMSGRYALDGRKQDPEEVGDTASHTADMENVNLVCAAFMAQVILDGKLEEFFCNSFDVEGAYLHIDYEEPQRVFCQFPETFRGELKGKLMRVLKAMYGLKKSGLLFERELDKCLKEAGLEPLPSDRSIYVIKDERRIVRTVLFTHVDDGQVWSVCKEDWNRIVEVCEKRFGILTKTIPSTCHVGINTEFEVDQNGKLTGAFIKNQKGYIESIIKKLDPEDELEIAPTPSIEGLFVNNETSPPVNKKSYQIIIGMLIYALITRFDIKKEVLCMAKRTQCPTEHDLVKVTRIIAYLKGTTGYGPRYFTTGGPILCAYTDASHNAYPDSSRSHSGHALYIGLDSGPVTTHTKIQMDCISLSSTEAEYVELANVAKSVLRARMILGQMGVEQKNPTQVVMDCKSAVAMANTDAINRRSAHIEMRLNFIKDLQKRGIVNVIHMLREFQKADFIAGRVLTKPEFKRQRDDFMNTEMS